jgi:hypothetical protein
VDLWLPLVYNNHPTPAPTPTRTATPSARQLITNSGFETDLGWLVPQTAYPAGYSTERVHTGSRSMRLGITGGGNVYSWSSCQQAIQIPTGLKRADLSFYYYPMMDTAGGDWLYLCILEANTDIQLQCDNWIAPNGSWQQRTFDLRSYAGLNIKIHFTVKNNGTGGPSSVYLDDVNLWVQ